MNTYTGRGPSSHKTVLPCTFSVLRGRTVVVELTSIGLGAALRGSRVSLPSEMTLKEDRGFVQ